MVPLPQPSIQTCRTLVSGVGSVKFAPTDLSAFMVIVQGPVPLHARSTP